MKKIQQDFYIPHASNNTLEVQTHTEYWWIYSKLWNGDKH